jgi:hypothetical protein
MASTAGSTKARFGDDSLTTGGLCLPITATSLTLGIVFNPASKGSLTRSIVT